MPAALHFAAEHRGLLIAGPQGSLLRNQRHHWTALYILHTLGLLYTLGPNVYLLGVSLLYGLSRFLGLSIALVGCESLGYSEFCWGLPVFCPRRVFVAFCC